MKTRNGYREYRGDDWVYLHNNKPKRCRSCREIVTYSQISGEFISQHICESDGAERYEPDNFDDRLADGFSMLDQSIAYGDE